MMAPIIDLTGKTFSNLTVISRAGVDASKRTLWECRCVCGLRTVVISRRLRDGATQSCGCQNESQIAGNPNWVDKWTKEKLDLLVYLREVDGLNWAKISEILDRPVSSCARRYHHLFSARPKPETPTEQKKIPLYQELGIKTCVVWQATLSEQQWMPVTLSAGIEPLSGFYNVR